MTAHPPARVCRVRRWSASRCAAAVGALSMLGVSPALAAPAVLRAVRVITTPEQSRFIVEFNQPVEHRLERQPAQPDLGVPERVVVDFPGARVAVPPPLPKALVEGPAIRIRAAATADGTRLLIDVPGLNDAGTFFLPDPYRLIIDVRGTPRYGPPKPTPLALIVATPPRPVATPRTPVLTVAPPPTAAPARHIKIVLDAGHGGKDPGASGVAAVPEKDIVLAIVKALRERLMRELGYEVVLTRDRDVFLPLEERTSIANTARADLFVSIHANASPNDAASGVETYYLRNTDDRATLRLAAMENGLRSMAGDAADGGAALILSDLIQNYKIQESVTLAEQLQRQVVESVRRVHDDVIDLGVKRGPFYVLVGAGMPCVLVEVGFVTNPIEGQRIAAAPYRALIVDGLLRGIRASVENARATGNL